MFKISIIMSDETATPSAHEVVDKVINSRINDARKAEVLGIYEELLQTVWDRILPTLGRVTTVAIMERAVILTKEKYPIVDGVKVGPRGLVLASLRASDDEADSATIREALKELVADLIDILAMLTGDILVTRLIKEIEGRRSS